VTLPYKRALIVGAGAGISASVARFLAAEGIEVALASRDVGKLAGLAADIGATTFVADAASPSAVAHLFTELDAKIGPPDIVIYNASGRQRGPITQLDPEQVRTALEVTAFGAFLVVQQAARRMLPANHGAILLTGATAGLKGFPLSAPFAMGKFALRGLAQSAARELGPQGIHVAHINIDGSVRSATRPDTDDGTLDPDGIAQSYLDLLRQPRSAWTHELDLRPWSERF
jgi:NAD(P)-dependent dehydrogenase (short-subunit alcohol dehydrogenase family)